MLPLNQERALRLNHFMMGIKKAIRLILPQETPETCRNNDQSDRLWFVVSPDEFDPLLMQTIFLGLCYETIERLSNLAPYRS